MDKELPYLNEIKNKLSSIGLFNKSLLEVLRDPTGYLTTSNNIPEIGSEKRILSLFLTGKVVSVVMEIVCREFLNLQSDLKRNLKLAKTYGLNHPLVISDALKECFGAVNLPEDDRLLYDKIQHHLKQFSLAIAHFKLLIEVIKYQDLMSMNPGSEDFLDLISLQAFLSSKQLTKEDIEKLLQDVYNVQNSNYVQSSNYDEDYQGLL